MNITEYIWYIRESRRRGFSDSVIKDSLILKGWPEKDIDSAFKKIDRDKMDNYFKDKGVEKQELKNQVTLFLDDELLDLLNKRAKKNMMNISELIEDILRRSTINQKSRKSSPNEKLDDTLVGIFSRKNTGPKKKVKKKKKR